MHDTRNDDTIPHFAVGNYIFGPVQGQHLEMVARAGFPGMELYRTLMMEYVDRPGALKELFDQHGLTVCTVSNGGPGMLCDFLTPAHRQQTIDDHVAFARDVLTVLGCTYFKMNMGARPEGGTTDEQLATLADALNELGRATAAIGIRLAPHPHIWGPVERPHEVRALLDQTDPAYVSWIPDTAHLNLGGGDPYELMRDYYERIAAVHWKDTEAAYRGYTGATPTVQQHQEKILYKDLGGGGVDIPRIWQLLQKRGYQGWITLDLDPPRPLEGEGTPEEKLLINQRFLREALMIQML